MKEVEAFKELITSILEEKDGFKLGEPWKFSGRSAGAVVPILREANFEREYITLPEAKEKVEVTDTGFIGKLKIKGNDKPIFIRAGTILEGKGTQSRAVEHNTIVLGTSEIDVKCVHQSHPVITNAKFEYFGIAPRPVVSRLLSSNDQYSVWSSVRCFAESFSSRFYSTANIPRETSTSIASNIVSRTDSLVEVKKAMRKLDSKMKEILEKVPALENQVGAIIVSTNGIEGIEVFDHPDSWKAHYKEVIENYECLTEDLPPLFKLDEEAVFEHIRAFLNMLRNESTIDRVNENTWILRCRDYIGEFTIFNNRVIHMFSVKSDEESTRNFRIEASVSTSPMFVDNRYANRVYFYESPVRSWSSEFNERLESFSEFLKEQIEKRKKFRDVLEAVRDGASWKELESRVNISKATLSRRLENGKRLGLIEEEYIDGKKIYKLTQLGKKVIECTQK